ncbi:MAG TPA: hypothetical protein VIP05_24530, partial [Burkholderiaceae bacterium]
MIPRLRPFLVAVAFALGATAAFAQLAAIPTSPSFRMEVNKGETGAPEATAVGARPIDAKGAAAHGEPPRASAPKAASGARTAEAGGRKGAASAASSASAPADALEHLRQRLAETLGATAASPNGSRYAMRVSNHGESGENVVGTVRPGAGAIASAHRAAAR